MIKLAFHELACVMSKVMSYDPDVTPSGNPEKDGTCVAGEAVPVKATAVGAWMCAAVVVPIRSWNWTWTRMVIAVVSSVTIDHPVPGEALGGDSDGPSRLAV